MEFDPNRPDERRFEPQNLHRAGTNRAVGTSRNGCRDRALFRLAGGTCRAMGIYLPGGCCFYSFPTSPDDMARSDLAGNGDRGFRFQRGAGENHAGRCPKPGKRDARCRPGRSGDCCKCGRWRRVGSDHRTHTYRPAFAITIASTAASEGEPEAGQPVARRPDCHAGDAVAAVRACGTWCV